MDTGIAQVISSTVTGIVSIAVAIIAGYFTIRAAQTKEGEKTSSQLQSNKAHKSWARLILYAAIVSVMSVPLGFVFTYTWNSLVMSEDLLGTSFASALISGMLSFTGYLLGAWAKKLEIGTGSLLFLFIIISIFALPVSYSIAYVGNWLVRTPHESLSSEAYNSFVVGGIICSVSFVIGILTSGTPQKNAA
jgi:hypothetical protein